MGYKVNYNSDDFVNNVTNANNQAMSDFSSLKNSYTDAFNNAANKYENNTDKYVGDQGYLNSLNLAQKGATQAAGGAAATATGAARTTGMSKSAAAAMGAGNTVNAYNAGLANQQAQVGNMYNAALGQQATLLNGNLSMLGNQFSAGANMATNRANNLSNMYSADAANKVNSNTADWNNQGWWGKVFSDENLKYDKEKVSDILERNTRNVSDLKINLRKDGEQCQ